MNRHVDPKDITLVAVANRKPTAPYYTYDEFFATARRFGFEPTIIGTRPGEYQGLGSKPKLLRDALSKGLLNAKLSHEEGEIKP